MRCVGHGDAITSDGANQATRQLTASSKVTYSTVLTYLCALMQQMPLLKKKLLAIAFSVSARTRTRIDPEEVGPQNVAEVCMISCLRII